MHLSSGLKILLTYPYVAVERKITQDSKKYIYRNRYTSFEKALLVIVLIQSAATTVLILKLEYVCWHEKLFSFDLCKSRLWPQCNTPQRNTPQRNTCFCEFFYQNQVNGFLV